ncbi:hypothetical protein [Terriglobus albidus]|uniref:hypothetical protein n=1 Tax=Terriglobus albidus TaxID=1592106 RepID=UPI0021DF452F|nr:hypothetical protein [Terriglobus albidus]
MRSKSSFGLVRTGAFLIFGSVAALAQTSVTVNDSSPGTYGGVAYFKSGSVIANSSMVQAPSGNIGIKAGTTVPFSPLTVYGNAAFGYDTTTSNGSIVMGKVPLVQLVGGGNPNAAPGLGILQLNMNAGGMNQAGSELYLGATGGTTATSRVAVQGGALLGQIGFFGDDGTNVRTRGAFINSYADTSHVPVSTGVIPANLALGTTSSGPILFFTNSAEKMRIDYNGNVGLGVWNPSQKLEVYGNIKISGGGASILFPDGTVQSTAWNGTTCGGDYAESVDVTGDRKAYEPGDVLVIDRTAPDKFAHSTTPYSRLVAGIYSTKPGLTGRRQGRTVTGEEAPMAMLGIVPTKVSAENGAIDVGDLLVSSGTEGYAMKGTDSSKLTGAVIGKAMGTLDSGKGVIEVLVSLQ